MTTADLARDISFRAHAGQFRRDGITPYVSHPERVAKRVAGDVDAEAVAWLNDVLEDTEETAESLSKAGIPPNVIEAVQTLTKAEGRDYEDYLTGVRENHLARKVKIQDMLDNLSDTPTDKQIIKYARGFLVLLAETPKAPNSKETFGCPLCWPSDPDEA